MVVTNTQVGKQRIRFLVLLLYDGVCLVYKEAAGENIIAIECIH